jgi:hypothetical protein
MHRVESVTVSVSINAGRRGQVEVELISPNGYKSELAKRRQYDSHTSGFQNWTFMSSVHWFAYLIFLSIGTRIRSVIGQYEYSRPRPIMHPSTLQIGT